MRKSVSFEKAKRYLNRYRGNVFMSCYRGDGWKLYRYIEKSPPRSVGNEGRKHEVVADVSGVPDGVISGNYWTNPRNL